MSNIDEWHLIGDKLTKYLGICSCQRKLKSIVDVLVDIWDNGRADEPHYYSTGKRKRLWTAEEYLILAVLDSRNLITHGVNCEYPIIIRNDFWDFILEVKDNPNLEDN